MIKVTISGLPIRGIHAYKKQLINKVRLGEQFELQIEKTKCKKTGTFPVSVVRNGAGKSEKIGNVLKEVSSMFKVVLNNGGNIVAIVTKEESLWGYGEEIICDYILSCPDSQQINRALHNIQKALQEPNLQVYNPTVVEYRHPDNIAASSSSGEDKPAGVQQIGLEEESRILYERQRENTGASSHETSAGTSDKEAVSETQTQELGLQETVKWSLGEEDDVDSAQAEEYQGDLPEELEDDPLTRQLYEKAIEEGVEIDHSIRVMVIGCFGQGKTTLVKRLFKESINDIDSTNGIDVNEFVIKGNDSSDWERKSDDDDSELARRLVSVAHSTQSLASQMDQDENDDGETFDDLLEKAADETGDNKTQYTQKRKEIAKYSSVESCFDNQDNKKLKLGATISQDNKENTHEVRKDSSGLLAAEPRQSVCRSDSGMLKKFKCEMKKSTQKDVVKAGTVWDFGGQFVFYSTHQLFHSRQAIYLLVFDLSKDLDEQISDDDFPNKKNQKTLKDYIKFWVSSVHCFVGSRNRKEPHIILVGTHKDKVKANQDVDNIFEEVRELFDGCKSLEHIYHQHFAVSNLDRGCSEVDELRSVVTELGKRLSEKRKPIPARWIPLEKSLRESQHPKLTTFEKIQEIDKENEFPVAKEEEIKIFLQFHHSRGRLFYFDDMELSKHVVLDPQYLIDAFKCIVTSRKFCIVRPSLRHLWTRFCEDAILEQELIDNLWGLNPEKGYLDNKDVLLAFLQRHRIISEVTRYEEVNSSLDCPQPLGHYIVPSLLKAKSCNPLVSEFMEGKKRTKVSLVYEFEYDSIVPTIFQRVTAAALGKWSGIKFKGQSLLFEDLSVFELRLDHAGMISVNGNKLELLVVNLAPPVAVVEAVCDSFRCFFEAVVAHEFQKLQVVGDPSISESKAYSQLLRCFHRSHGHRGSENTHSVKDLPNTKHFPCPDYAHQRLKVEYMNKWYYKEIDIETVTKRLLETKECSKLATAIGKGWEALGYELGLGKVAVDQIKMDEDTTVKRILGMFMVWQEKYKDKATLDVLVQAIRNLPAKVLRINKDILTNIINGFG